MPEFNYGAYVVMHNYYDEGWKVVGSVDTAREAVDLREKDLRNGGGECAIFVFCDPRSVYHEAYDEEEDVPLDDLCPDCAADAERMKES